MNDKEIRRAVRAQFASELNQGLVLEELSLERGLARVDLALMNESFWGFELKSDLDTLIRLPQQIEVYGSIFDSMTLIVGYRHAYHALRMVPDWWGVKLVARTTPDLIEFHPARIEGKNPKLDPQAIARMLWKTEAMAILESRRPCKEVRSKSRSFLCSLLAEELDISSLRRNVCEAISLRQGWRSVERSALSGD
jgi:hypothetical protein